MSYDAIIFDNDGVLTRPTDRELLQGAIRKAFRESGVHDPPPDHVESMIGVTVETLESICAHHDIDPADFWRRRDEVASRVQCEAIRRGEKEAYPDVGTVRSLDAPIGVVSNNQHRTVEFVVETLDLPAGPVYGRAPTVADIRRKKPNPHYLELALSDLGTERVLFVGDSNADLGAAAAAGVDSAFVRREHRTGYALDHEPTHELDGLDELPELFDG